MHGWVHGGDDVGGCFTPGLPVNPNPNPALAEEFGTGLHNRISTRYCCSTFVFICIAFRRKPTHFAVSESIDKFDHAMLIIACFNNNTGMLHQYFATLEGSNDLT